MKQRKHFDEMPKIPEPKGDWIGGCTARLMNRRIAVEKFDNCVIIRTKRLKDGVVYVDSMRLSVEAFEAMITCYNRINE